MSHLTIEKVNEVYLKITTEPHVEHELKDRFTFEVPNKKFMPQYRNKYWDGFVHLYNLKKIDLLLKYQIKSSCPSTAISTGMVLYIYTI